MKRIAAAAVLLASTLGTVAVDGPAIAATPSCDEVHIGPAPDGAPGSGYFVADLAAGAVGAERLLVANPASTPCRIALSSAIGRTALNSGDTYVAAADTWVHGLPPVVLLAAGARTTLPFEIRVPQTAAAGQYLYGVVGSPAAGSDAGAPTGVSVHVTSRVAIGVAVTVPGAAVARVDVPQVTARTDGASVSIRLTERNTGTTWEHPKGAVTIGLPGRSLRIPVASNTLLAGGVATLAVAADGVPSGTYPVEVALAYGAGRSAHWGGRLTFTTPAAVRTGDQLTVTTDVPTWAYWGLGVLGALLVAAMAAVVVLARRSRSRAASV